MSARPLFDLRPEPTTPATGRQLSCVSCGLHKDARSPRMPPYGENRKRIMVCGEAPGESEDKAGKPWQGKSGRLVQEVMSGLGIDLFRDCVSTNAVNCRPPENRAPTGFETACCRHRIVDPAIAEHRPRVIIAMGQSAVASILGPMCQNALGDSIGKWRGFTVPVPELNAWVCPVYHPSYVLKEENRTEIGTIWRQDVKRAVRLLDEPVPAPEDLASLVDVLTDEGEVLRVIYAAHESQYLSFDYETTGLNPTLHQVVCASFATSADRACAFMLPKDGPIPGAWASLLSDPNVGKISHNLKFEHSWTLEHFDVEDINWAWDSMIASHVCDNRVGICSLKHQAFLNFGIRDWSTVIEPYLKSIDEKDPRAPNRIWEFIETYGERDCLIYNGLDSLIAYRLSIKQREIIDA